MSDFFNSIKQGLTEAVEYSEKKCPKAIVHKFSAIDVKATRSNLKMSQTVFIFPKHR
jgi:putative transcriptional regulator